MSDPAYAKANPNYPMFDPNSQMVDHTNTNPDTIVDWPQFGRPENGPLPNENLAQAYEDAPVEAP